MHTVSDFACVVCGETLGWRYDDASEEGQKYKIGKWILERERVGVVEDDDDDDDDEEEDGIVEKEVRALMEMPDVDFGIREERERLFRGY